MPILKSVIENHHARSWNSIAGERATQPKQRNAETTLETGNDESVFHSKEQRYFMLVEAVNHSSELGYPNLSCFFNLYGVVFSNVYTGKWATKWHIQKFQEFSFD